MFFQNGCIHLEGLHSGQVRAPHDVSLLPNFYYLMMVISLVNFLVLLFSSVAVNFACGTVTFPQGGVAHSPVFLFSPRVFQLPSGLGIPVHFSSANDACYSFERKVFLVGKLVSRYFFFQVLHRKLQLLLVCASTKRVRLLFSRRISSIINAFCSVTALLLFGIFEFRESCDLRREEGDAAHI